ncbi:MAG: FAD:protein FMN transferase [Planctomycetota bacterium]
MSADPGRYEYAQIIMGVEARITMFARDETTSRAAARAAFDRMVELEAVMSDYRPDSELMRLCRRSGTGPVPVSDDLFGVLDLASAFASASDGAFDPTVGPMVRLWREARRTGKRPGEADLEDARGRVGWSLVALDPDRLTVTLARPGMQLDLGGIGKGFAVDAALAELRAEGVEMALVDLGGDMAIGAAPPGHAGWRVALADGGPTPQVLRLAECAIAMSGDTEQFVEIDGVRYSHIVDPRTGLGLVNRAQVTVIAPDAATADALASALSVLGPEQGLRLLERHPGTSASIEVATDAGLRRVTSGTALEREQR